MSTEPSAPQDLPPLPTAPPAAVPSEAAPWSLDVRPDSARVTGRLRRLVTGLPDWEPTPPGEDFVRRPTSDR